MSTIEFVVRSDAGALSRGTAGQGVAQPIFAPADSDISLHLSQAQIRSYDRNGNALEIILSDGQMIVIANFFGPDGQPQSDLFISSDNQLTEVDLVVAGDGRYVARYVSQDPNGKWGDEEDLYFAESDEILLASPQEDDSVGMLGAGLLGVGILPIAAGAAAVAAIPAVLGDTDERGDDDDDDGVQGTILTGTVETNHVVNADDHADGVDITGTGTVGATVTVTIDGQTQTTTVDEDGNWTCGFPPTQIDTGTYVTDVNVTITLDGESVDITDQLSVDTEASVTIDIDEVGGDGTVNAAEAEGGITITGTVEAGSSVTVTYNSVDYTATVTGDTWTCDIPEVTDGTYIQNVTVVAIDANGNSASTTGDFQVDTETSVTVDTHVETDGTVNFVERSDGMTLTGTAEAGASVVVTFGVTTLTTTATAGGSWSVDFSASQIPTGEVDVDVSVTSTDTAGNAATVTGSVNVDTLVSTLTITSGPVAGDDVVNLAEHGRAITVTGQVEIGSSVTVTLAGNSQSADVDASGTWSVTYAAGSLATGEYDTALVVDATDAAGNTSQITQSVRVDTDAGDVALSNAPIEIDDVVNVVEHADGVRIHGTATPGLAVTVTLGDASHVVMASAAGTWSSNFAASEIPGGTYQAAISASITDDAGNSKTVTDSVAIDTDIGIAIDAPIEGDDIVSGAEATDGFVISGTAGSGDAIAVTFAGGSYTTTAGSGGAWSVIIPAADIPGGEADATIGATATDAAGNSADVTHDIRIDTVVQPLTSNGVAADGNGEVDDLVNRAEASDGITLTGTVEIGSTVSVTFEGTTRDAAVDAQGNWSVDFSAAEVPQGEYDTTVSISATDAVGNTRTITDTFEVDTTPPEAPTIESFTATNSGTIRELTTSITSDEIQIDRLDGATGVTDVTPTPEMDATYNELSFEFDTPIPAGSHLVMTASDDSGNATSTLFVADQTGTNAVDTAAANLDGFDIEGIDMSFAQDTVLTLDADQLGALSDHSNTLTIHGGGDDTVNIAGATDTSENSMIGGRSYSHYTLGDDGGTLIIDDEIIVQT